MTILQALSVAFSFTGQTMPDAALAEMASELSAYPQEAVLLALKRCRSELKSIKYSDILDRLPGQHPGVEEAWSIVSQANNEQASMVWTETMREAYGVVAPLSDDPVAARMAFKEKYQALVSAARARQEWPKWSVSLGWDVRGRELAVQQAKANNLISEAYARLLLPPTDSAVPATVAQLLGTVKAIPGATT